MTSRESVSAKERREIRAALLTHKIFSGIVAAVRQCTADDLLDLPVMNINTGPKFHAAPRSADHVGHIVQPGSPAGEELRGRDRSLSENSAGIGCMCKFYDLVLSGKEDIVDAYDRAAPNGGDSHLAAIIGGKTGTTSQAGKCLTLYTVCKNGHDLMVTVCNVPPAYQFYLTMYVASVTAYGNLACWKSDPEERVYGTTGDYKSVNAPYDQQPQYDGVQEPGNFIFLVSALLQVKGFVREDNGKEEQADEVKPSESGTLDSADTVSHDAPAVDDDVSGEMTDKTEESSKQEAPTVSVTQDDITKIIVQKLKKDRTNNERIGAILRTYGVARVSDLPANRYEAFLTDLSQL